MRSFLLLLLFSPVLSAQDESDSAGDVLESTGNTLMEAPRTLLSEGASRLREIRDEMRTWDQSVLGFRKEHHFTLSLGPSSTVWRFKTFGDIVNKNFKSSGIFSKFQYSFHIPIYKSFGYFLGSSAGYISETKSDSELVVSESYMLPGVLAGFTLNISPGFRILLGLDYYLERWVSIGSEFGPKIYVTARALDSLAAVDLFFSLKWAVRFEYHLRQVDYLRPKSSGGKDVDAKIAREDTWLGLGLLFHLM